MARIRKIARKMVKIARFNIGVGQNPPAPPKLSRTKSVKNVRGEKWEIAFPQPGSWLTGINIPLIKIIGNLTSDESIITSAGVSVGRAAISTPIAEKQRLPRMSPRMRIRG